MIRGGRQEVLRSGSEGAGGDGEEQTCHVEAPRLHVGDHRSRRPAHLLVVFKWEVGK